MKRSLLSLVLLGLAATAAQAQNPFDAAPAAPGLPAAQASPSDLPSPESPEMYMMMKMWEKYDDPKEAVRRKAEQKAADRRARLASQKWYGHSQSRPMVNPAFGFSYANRWVGTGIHPYQWRSSTYPVIVRLPVVNTVTR